MGKTFTVDPISKRSLDNFGEEEKYYIQNHHEPIISIEQFDKALNILCTDNKTVVYAKDFFE